MEMVVIMLKLQVMVMDLRRLCIVGENKRLSLLECHDDFSGLIDAAKYADVVLLLIVCNLWVWSGESIRKIVNLDQAED
ncbi:hypothetical protein MKW92_022700 [Papaver armeniacum]|nr:hypothetical protein MKW92_022700 [Papaver armeniacum]